MAPPISTDQNGALRVSNREEDSLNTEPSMSGKNIVGMIIPPPDIRTIVDKTALFVARNGIDFENKIKEREASNVRFNFLSPTDPYHAYYKQKVLEHETGVASTTTEVSKLHIPEAVREHIQKAEFIPRNPPKPFEFTADPSTINAFDLDLIRLTALFVARNGRQFLTQLMNREVRNYQFDFLKPQHSNFQYFTKLVEQYTKVIIPAKNVVEEIRENSTHQKLMADVRYRVGWEKHQKAIKDRENAEIEQERLAYSQIDWHDFVVVQTVDFQPSETLNLPPLCSPKDVGARILLQQRTEAAKAAQDSVAMDMDSESDEEAEEDHEQQNKPRAAYEVTQPAPAAPSAGNVVIRDYDPKASRKVPVNKAVSEKYIISPLTNERIPADKLQEHVRYNTVDPQYKEQRDREQMERQDEDPTNASGTEISRNIAKLAERRTDIFGVGAAGAEQTIIGKKLGEEERMAPRADAKTIWDGQQSTIDATTRAAQQQVTIDQQISEIHKQHGYGAAGSADPNKTLGPKGSGTIPPPPSTTGVVTNVAKILPMTTPSGMPGHPHGMGMPPHHGMMPPHGMVPNPFLPPAAMAMPPHGMPPQYEDPNMPPSKRFRVEEAALEPEDLWLRKYSGQIGVNVATPQTTEWNLEGKTFKVSLDMSSMVTALKSLIQEETGMPASKQKLVYEGHFMKDNFTLAYYNVMNHGTVQLQLKERGGRKK
ncbi:pre-mRNA splicing factor PRP21 like protein domain-containing protein [Ditylenchus destructor]|uniref:Pre-mRNA splicing factor PRP21 like protein domain-containing protein n=1 Tax=Ditylenchus destructor TaxID=166010 RepID=A0AAD4R0G0_9BILA|nr:pre-mRNA splicing factor PRP21 like protein domain-containing protein [Ditylenchus destructor]